MHNNSTHIRMDSSAADYREKLAAAKAQAGMFEIMNEGAAGAITKKSRDPKYGVPRMGYGEVAGGMRDHFAQGDGTNFNSPMHRNFQTGNLETGSSATQSPHTNPEFFASPDERLMRMAAGKQGFEGYNDRNNYGYA